MKLKAEKRIEDFQKKGFGIFVHYGAYSQYEHGEWALNIRKMDKDEYEKKALEFDYSSFDAEQLVLTAKKAGVKYITFTTRHHDGFSLYDTRGLNQYDVMHTPNGRDILKDFVNACNKYDIMPFLYHTTLDWYNVDFTNNFTKYLKYLRDSIEILSTEYGKIGGFWLDGNWSKPNDDWELDELYGVIRKHQPDAIIINNTGLEAQGVLGHEEIDCVTFEQGLPQKLEFVEGQKVYIGEMCFPLCEHWGIATDINYKSIKTILEAMCSCRKVGANFMLGVTPKSDSTLPIIQQGMLEELGRWVNLNEQSFYDALPSEIEGEGKDFALMLDEHNIYLFIHDVSTWGGINIMKSSVESIRYFHNFSKEIKSARWIDNGKDVKFNQNNEKQLLTVEPESFLYGESWVVRVAQLEV
jgi:alpha-L-fucosidase